MRASDVWIPVLALLVLIGVGALIFWFPGQSEQPAYAPIGVTGSSLNIVKATASGSVIVDAEVQQSGFVSLNQALGEAPGPQLTVSELLEPGSYANLELVLPSPLPGQAYFVLMFTDDGDGVYESRIDLPVMSEGQVVKSRVNL